jgi:hypothetical protein
VETPLPSNRPHDHFDVESALGRAEAIEAPVEQKKGLGGLLQRLSSGASEPKGVHHPTQPHCILSEATR